MILEVAVHSGFPVLDTTPHVLTAAKILDPTRVFVVQHEDVLNPHWLNPGTPSVGEQQHGDSLLHERPFVLIPSAVSRFSWNLIFDPDSAEGLCAKHRQQRFALDPRLHPPAST